MTSRRHPRARCLDAIQLTSGLPRCSVTRMVIDCAILYQTPDTADGSTRTVCHLSVQTLSKTVAQASGSSDSLTYLLKAK